MSAKLHGPPSEPVEWEVSYRHESGMGYIRLISARTAWLAHVEACPTIPGNPAFGDCKVTRET
jgi:hypothetical protein